MTNHADPIDKASELADMYNEQALRAVQVRNRPEQVQNEDGSWPHEECVECGIEIPPARLALGKVRCVDCQTTVERRTNAYR